MKTFGGAFLHPQLITSNKSIRQCPFYYPVNVFILKEGEMAALSVFVLTLLHS